MSRMEIKPQLQIELCRNPQIRFGPTDNKPPTDLNLAIGHFSSAVGKIFNALLILPALFTALLVLPCKPAEAQNGTMVDQKMIRIASVTDPNLIQFFLFEFLITDT